MPASRLRLCFANPEPETIKQGVAVLAEVCRREFGVPLRSANVEKRSLARHPAVSECRREPQAVGESSDLPSG